MNKYYVTFGKFKYLTMAGNQYQACIKAYRAWSKQNTEEVTPVQFHVSQRGFAYHSADEHINLHDIIRVMYMANNGEEI